ncbi:TPA: hypothetical protein DDW35_12170, partial [Candidatus Sumerlaeota bacterium]|nr:hypothetical protein [Candidatus Sumerlaeota bacterium]
MPDEKFGAVHLGIGQRSMHSITSTVTNYPVHPQRTRVTQMVWLDPSAPPKAIGVQLYFEAGN